MAEIRKLLKSMPADQFTDEWGRTPADLVPDAIVEAVQKLQEKRKGKGRSRR